MAKKTVLSWTAEQTPRPLQGLLTALAQEYPIVEDAGSGAIALRFAPGAAPKGGLEVKLAKGVATIAYDKTMHAARAVGALLAGLVEPKRPYTEQTPFETFGLMLDCSRNAVMKVEHFQAWLRQLALLGYNMAMLYCEDTYELSGEPMFGYLRGRYTAEELRQIDQYAAALGIEMVGCIQTLGHLEQVLRWPAFLSVKDTAGVLMVDEPATYALIEKMIAAYAQNFASRRIHVGMDEAHDVGRGRFLDLFGYERGYDMFNRHLAKVIEICHKHGLSTMIWSDMYFRMGSKNGGYYDKECRVPEDVKKAIPRECQLVYWDYYHDNEEFYLDWIGRHRELGFDPVMASGVWTWSRFWYDQATTEKTATPCVRACRKAGLKEFLFTLWGDDGGYCEFDSSLAGLAYGAELAYAGDDFRQADLERRFAAVCGAAYGPCVEGSGLQSHGGVLTLWDDPIQGVFWKSQKLTDSQYWTTARSHYQRLLAKLAPVAKKTSPIDFHHGYAIAACLLEKVELGLELEKAYASRDEAALEAVAGRIPRMIKAIDNVLATWRRQWYRRNKPQGFETMQVRLGGLKQRYVELKQRLGELTAGEIERIPELEEMPSHAGIGWRWRSVASGSDIL